MNDAQIMDLLCAFAKQAAMNGSFLTGGQGGRLGSSIAEATLHNVVTVAGNLTGQFRMETRPASETSWYDAKVTEPIELFINIKSSQLSGKSADNVGSFQGLGYALTGLVSKSKNSVDVRKHIKTHINLDLGRDYYFLIVNKTDPTDIFWTSFFRLKKIVFNASNEPFQCDWTKNREFTDRNRLEQWKYIRSVLLKSAAGHFQKAVDIHNALGDNSSAKRLALRVKEVPHGN